MSLLLIVLGGCFIGYGVSVMAALSGSNFFIVWYVLGGVLLGCGLAMRFGVASFVPLGLRRLVVGLAVVGLMAISALSALALSRAGETAAPGVNVVIVLGSQVRESGPSEALKARLDLAREYLLANPNTRCIVSGGKGPNEPRAEADVMYDYLIDRGVEPARIAKEAESTTTYENLKFSASQLSPTQDTVAIVTNDFHLYRAIRLAKGLGYVDVRGIGAPSEAWYLPTNVLRECGAIVKDGLERKL